MLKVFVCVKVQDDNAETTVWDLKFLSPYVVDFLQL